MHFRNKELIAKLTTWIEQRMPCFKEQCKKDFQAFSVWINSLSWKKFVIFIILFSIISDAVGNMFSRTFLQNIINNLTVIFIWLSIGLKIFAKTKIDADKKVQIAKVDAEKETLKRQLVEAKIQVMQAQIEPHFLFNTLSSLHFLIESDQKKASQMLMNLTTYLRYSLPQARENLPFNTLGKEIENIHAYLDIMEIRMGERLRVEYDISNELKSEHFPTMMLQPIVENAIKYGIEESINGGVITLSAQKIDGFLEMSVKDTGPGLGFTKNSGNGMALNNIKNRLQMLYDGNAEFIMAPNEPTGVIVKIQVPIKSN
jgi:LytS/YehU family sensor histidine kinase